MTPLTLQQAVLDLRAECGHSLSGSHGVNSVETLRYLLRRVQRELYQAHDWPQLRVEYTATLSAGDRFLATSGIGGGVDLTLVNDVWLLDSATWRQLDYGIDPSHYNITAVGTQGLPQRWRVDHAVTSTPRFEFWPTPQATYSLRVITQRALAAFVSDSDTSTLDGTLLVMFAAAEVLARQKSENAGLTLQKAQAYLRSLLRNAGSNKRQPIPIAR